MNCGPSIYMHYKNALDNVTKVLVQSTKKFGK